ncbi:MAG: dienelactone hydrolase family protein [Chitinophagaceae bacterium]|nr:dienelactone hydrolase family protein [Chitinophagaceae bacterium]
MKMRATLATLLACLALLASSMCRKKNISSLIISPIQPGPYTLFADTNRINEAFGGYYIAMPSPSDSTLEKFPLLIFLHGLGQRGNGKEDLKYLLFDGIGKVIKDQRMPSSFVVKDQKFSFIIVSPQYQTPPDEKEVMQLLDSIVARYPVRTNRIYISGLSLGGRIATLVAAKYPERFAAMVPIAGVATTPGMGERCKSIAEANLPVWELHNEDDPMADVNDARRFIDSVISYFPAVLPRLTVFDKYGHDAWTTALDTSYRENGMNIYEWMLQYYR